MKLIRILLFPFSMLYGCIVYLRNKLYDKHLLSSTSFDIPVICVGNLSMGGTGKSPHIEYIIRLLNNNYKIATLSRGYGRSATEFGIADASSKVADIGDEPMQFKNKFPEITVAVDKKRVNGINKLLAKFPSLNVILLDDAFQHRAVTAGLSILLTDYNKLYTNDVMLPTGTLREFRSGAKRADIIIITKCPEIVSSEERAVITSKINKLEHQHVYFSRIKYGSLVAMNTTNAILSKETDVLLLTGIANPQPLEDYIINKVKSITPAKFPDHHNYTEKELMGIIDLFNTIASPNKIVITTEKDFMRLKSSPSVKLLNTLPIFYLPIEIAFLDTDNQMFNNQIINYVSSN
jgi:tetraacyldisaccharide 4'-kinase